MAKKVTEVKNKQGFRIIVMPGIVPHVLFNKYACDLCGKKIDLEEDIYYEAVINNFYCETCHKAYLSNAIRYKSDIKNEEKNFNKAKEELEGAEWWNETLF